MSDGPILKWDDELDTGTVKIKKCKCTLQDAARARHCRYCEPQITIDELEQHVDDRDEDWDVLYEEKKKLRAALEEIKKKCIGATTIRPITDLMNIRSIAEGVLSESK